MTLVMYLMSAERDVDLYVASRSDITNPFQPRQRRYPDQRQCSSFMGHSLVAIPGWLSINETHESDSTLYGSILFGNPKNLDIASDSKLIAGICSTMLVLLLVLRLNILMICIWTSRLARHNSFVIAFKGAKGL